MVDLDESFYFILIVVPENRDIKVLKGKNLNSSPTPEA